MSLSPRFSLFIFLFPAMLTFGACRSTSTWETPAGSVTVPRGTQLRPLRPGAPPELQQTVDYGVAEAKLTPIYDASYVKLPYPDGDVPLDRGACTDVVIRAFRHGGLDLQKAVHEDMGRAFSEYPAKWGLNAPDPNIDHRRVPNLMKFFERQGKSLPITLDPDDYESGDVVAWELGDGGPTHIGLVTNLFSPPSGRNLMVHNIGGGAQIQDVLFAWKIIGHYRYF
jgi:uncharacterized protein YijF (DUF1287 family)